MKRKNEKEKGYIDEFIEYQNNIYNYDYPRNGELPFNVKYPNRPLAEAIYNWIVAFLFFLTAIYMTVMYLRDYDISKEFYRVILVLGGYFIIMVFPTILFILVGFGMFRKYKEKKRDIEIYIQQTKRMKKRKILRKRQNDN